MPAFRQSATGLAAAVLAGLMLAACGDRPAPTAEAPPSAPAPASDAAPSEPAVPAGTQAPAASPAASEPPASAQSPTPGDNVLIGRWARSAEECARPEFVFKPDSLTVQGDADGEPLVDEYPHVKYTVAPGTVTAALGTNHSFGQTPKKDELAFNVVSNDKVEMQRTKHGNAELVRCP